MNKSQKVSAIIPTMWRAQEFTNHLIDTLIEDEAVGEIIIIDNSLTGFYLSSDGDSVRLDRNHKYEKVSILKQPENLYVNPSWNLGIEEAYYEKFIIFNDDITIPYNFVSQLQNLLTKDKGVIGVEAKSVITVDKFDDKNTTFLDRKIDLKPITTRDWGFGIIIAGHTVSYHKIPENIRIWHGDDYLVKMNNEQGNTNYVIDDIPIFTKMSATSDSEEFNEIKNVDTLMYERFVIRKEI